VVQIKKRALMLFFIFSISLEFLRNLLQKVCVFFERCGRRRDGGVEKFSVLLALEYLFLKFFHVLRKFLRWEQNC